MGTRNLERGCTGHLASINFAQGLPVGVGCVFGGTLQRPQLSIDPNLAGSAGPQAMATETDGRSCAIVVPMQEEHRVFMEGENKYSVHHTIRNDNLETEADPVDHK